MLIYLFQPGLGSVVPCKRKLHQAKTPISYPRTADDKTVLTISETMGKILKEPYRRGLLKTMMEKEKDLVIIFSSPPPPIF